ncbi:MAG: sensor histidine kinase [Actinomycetes bacterium]
MTEQRPEGGAAAPQRDDRRGPGLRARLLVAFVLALAFASIGSILVTRVVLLQQLDRRIDAELNQEAEELRTLAVGNDPATGEPFGDDVARIFEVFLTRNVPRPGEAMLTFLDGEPFLRSRVVSDDFRIDTDPALTARWGVLDVPDRGVADTPAGPLEYLALPVGDRGVFVVSEFRDIAAADIEAGIRAAGGVGLAAVLVGSLLAAGLAAGVLRPVREVISTARSITETDLSERIDVRGSDEIAELASTFNDMLDRLEAAFAAQRTFIDDAGHELRTPITVVRGHLELLELTEDPDERRESVALVLDELDRMGRLVDDLLTLTKASRADFVRPAPTELDALVDDVARKAAGLAPGRVRVVAAPAVVVDLDEQRVTQSLLQFVANAVAHAGDGPIELGAHATDSGVVLSVADHGPGVPAEHRDRVFQRFARGERAAADGAGLGLAIVAAIAEAHGGVAEVVDTPGGGATFRLVLPATPRRADVPDTAVTT